MSYDVLVIGGGPAGLSAALNVRARGRSVLVVSNPLEENPLWRAEKVDNHLGMPALSGAELLKEFRRHAEEAGAAFLEGKVLNTVRMDDIWYVGIGSDMENAGALVLAGGVARGKKYPGEAEFLGRGVSYCATCDGPFYRKKTVAIVGGGDSAVQAAIELAKLCPTVYLLVRSRIRAQEILVKRMKELENVKVYMGYTPEEVKGDKKVQGLVIKNKADGKTEELSVDGVFVEAGGIPNNSYLPSDVKVNSLGEIMTNKEGETNVDGLFAAGDVTDCRNKQVIIAAGEGAAAALAAHEYLLRSGL